VQRERKREREKREREREREREESARARATETDRQTDRQTETVAGRHTMNVAKLAVYVATEIYMKNVYPSRTNLPDQRVVKKQPPPGPRPPEHIQPIMEIHIPFMTPKGLGNFSFSEKSFSPFED
jgi:hypothetical protein